jgi:hypothetical protein
MVIFSRAPEVWTSCCPVCGADLRWSLPIRLGLPHALNADTPAEDDILDPGNEMDKLGRPLPLPFASSHRVKSSLCRMARSGDPPCERGP